MEEVFVEDAEDDVDDEDGDEQQDGEVGEGGFKDVGGSLDVAGDGGGERFAGEAVELGEDGAEGVIAGVEVDVDGWKAVEAVDVERAGGLGRLCDEREGDEFVCGGADVELI